MLIYKKELEDAKDQLNFPVNPNLFPESLRVMQRQMKINKMAQKNLPKKMKNSSSVSYPRPLPHIQQSGRNSNKELNDLIDLSSLTDT